MLELGFLMVADELHVNRWYAGLHVLIYVGSFGVLKVLSTQKPDDSRVDGPKEAESKPVTEIAGSQPFSYHFRLHALRRRTPERCMGQHKEAVFDEPLFAGRESVSGSEMAVLPGVEVLGESKDS